MARDIIERFMRFVSPEPFSGCWLWTGFVCTNGYGLFTTDKLKGAHRASYEIHVGPIPEGKELDHLCRVRSCVNPRHLEPIAHGENVRRGDHGERKKTHCPKGHPYSAANTYRVPEASASRSRAGRQCRECRIEYWKHYIRP